MTLSQGSSGRPFGAGSAAAESLGTSGGSAWTATVTPPQPAGAAAAAATTSAARSHRCGCAIGAASGTIACLYRTSARRRRHHSISARRRERLQRGLPDGTRAAPVVVGLLCGRRRNCAHRRATTSPWPGRSCPCARAVAPGVDAPHAVRGVGAAARPGFFSHRGRRRRLKEKRVASARLPGAWGLLQKSGVLQPSWASARRSTELSRGVVDGRQRPPANPRWSSTRSGAA